MIKGFTETDTNVKTPKDVNITEEPLKSDPINTDRVDINVLKAKLEKKESQEYYVENIKATDVDKPLRDFHNYNKRSLINAAIHLFKKNDINVLDTSIGRGGDLNKYYPHDGFKDKKKSIRFLLGLDISSNINEAARRFYQTYTNKGLSMFLQYDTSKSISNSDGLMNKDDKKYHDVLFTDNQTKVDKKYKQLGKKGFDLISSQFSFHYYFKDEDTLRGYLQNISSLLTKGGYFIGTCYDGVKIFNALKDSKPDSVIKFKEVLNKIINENK